MPVIRSPIAPRTGIAPTILPSTDGTTIPTKEGAAVATESVAPAVFRSRAYLPTLVGGIYDNHSDRRRASHAPRGRGILRLSPTVVTIRRALATRKGICGVSTNLWGPPMEYVLRTKTSGIFADGAFVPPVVIPLLSVLAIVLWATYKAVM